MKSNKRLMTLTLLFLQSLSVKSTTRLLQPDKEGTDEWLPELCLLPGATCFKQDDGYWYEDPETGIWNF